MNRKGTGSRPVIHPNFRKYCPWPNRMKAPGFEPGDMQVQVLSGSPTVLGLVAEQQALNLPTGVRFSQGGPNIAGIAPTVERDVAIVEVADSTSAVRTNEREVVSGRVHIPAFAGSIPALSTRFCRITQLVRVPLLQSGSHWFESSSGNQIDGRSSAD